MKAEVDVGRLLGSLSMRATRRRGEWYALCPNPDHDDRHLGSFTLTDDPGSDRHAHFRCYSCGAYGDAIDLVKLVLGVGYHAAVCWIEDSAFVPAVM